MLRIVYDNIQLYNVRERKVHLTEASSIGFVQNVHCIFLTRGLGAYKTTGSDHSVCTILSAVKDIFKLTLWV